MHRRLTEETRRITSHVRVASENEACNFQSLCWLKCQASNQSTKQTSPAQPAITCGADLVATWRHYAIPRKAAIGSVVDTVTPAAAASLSVHPRVRHLHDSTRVCWAFKQQTAFLDRQFR